MKTCCLLALIVAGAAAAKKQPVIADTYFGANDAPKCYVDAAGRTVVRYVDTQHTSFKCTHSNGQCSCTREHPTHHKGGCKQFAHTNGQVHQIHGDCAATGRNLVIPTSGPSKSLKDFSNNNSVFTYNGHKYKVAGVCPAKGCFAVRGGGNSVGMYGLRCDYAGNTMSEAMRQKCQGAETGSCTWSGPDPAASACYIKVSDDPDFFRLNVDCPGRAQTWSCSAAGHDGITFYDAAGKVLRKIRANGPELQGNKSGFTYFDALPKGTDYVYIRGGGISRFSDYSTTNVAFFKGM